MECNSTYTSQGPKFRVSFQIIFSGNLIQIKCKTDAARTVACVSDGDWVQPRLTVIVVRTYMVMVAYTLATSLQLQFIPMDYNFELAKAALEINPSPKDSFRYHHKL